MIGWGSLFWSQLDRLRSRIDAARFLSNRSSGRMGVLLAQAARFRGATVHLVHGPLDLPDAWLEGSAAHPSRERRSAQHSTPAGAQPSSDVLVMTAAVADLRREKDPSRTKLAKQQLQAGSVLRLGRSA